MNRRSWFAAVAGAVCAFVGRRVAVAAPDKHAMRIAGMERQYEAELMVVGGMPPTSEARTEAFREAVKGLQEIARRCEVQAQVSEQLRREMMRAFRRKRKGGA